MSRPYWSVPRRCSAPGEKSALSVTMMIGSVGREERRDERQRRASSARIASADQRAARCAATRRQNDPQRPSPALRRASDVSRRRGRASEPSAMLPPGENSGLTSVRQRCGCAGRARVGEIDQQVGDDVDGRGEEDDPLDHREILGEDRRRSPAARSPAARRQSRSTTAPPSSAPNCSPKIVTTGISAFFSPWRRMTSRLAQPLRPRRRHVLLAAGLPACSSGPAAR